MMLQLNPPLELITPKGKGLCHFLIDYGIEADLIWVTFINNTGECWSFRNQDIKITNNITFGRSVKQAKV